MRENPRMAEYLRQQYSPGTRLRLDSMNDPYAPVESGMTGTVEMINAACNTPVEEGMEVLTESADVRKARRVNLQLILSRHKMSCPICSRNENCQLKKLASDMNLLRIPYRADIREGTWDKTAPIIRDESQCIKFMHRVQICDRDGIV